MESAMTTQLCHYSTEAAIVDAQKNGYGSLPT